ncbi:dirigent protein 22-like [Diospyros lotus]|uniref:dirigent protein 22-like n=1 Tax=Diospyros lotus TaxID=55363 RepID=UPI0022546280|nr:dirigent protein 22-like [Diospyros lotus]
MPLYSTIFSCQWLPKNSMASSSLNYSLLAVHLVLFSTLIKHSFGTFYEEMAEGIALKSMDSTIHLHFYFHDIVSGKHPTAVKIAQPQDTPPSGFGTAFMMDDPLTEGPEPTSKLVGKAQGIYAIASQSLVELLMVVNYEFVEGKYNGSSISILGRNPVFDDTREMPIVGGSGLFRLARGYALAHTVWFDPNTGDATVEYNVYVMLSS